ncbi:unnamed protein product [Bemisia tabaci]|uniref:THAP-type domain-containing protein n=1 Tax=Bemisia tabaci TaxID=7038 RepID=A0AAI8Y622_BEMTA|nr:unnamed protein product [Bemisia tabaci]
MANLNSFARCFVPNCTSSSKSTPSKVFFPVPRGEARQQWCSAVGRSKPMSSTSPHHCCQDHFDVENDVYNWDWCLTQMHAGCKVKFQLKENVLPQKVPKCSHKQVKDWLLCGV